MEEQLPNENDSFKGIVRESVGQIKTWSKKRLFGYGLLLLVFMFLLVQVLNAAKYQALVQVIQEDRIGVNPTDQRLDFGDLPRDKSAVRVVNLENHSPYKVKSFIMVWKFGELAELIKVSQNYFTLKPGDDVELEFTVHMPNSSEFRYYKGRVWVFQIPKPW